MRVAGIMSGTSLDGIDVAIVDIDARLKLSVLGHYTAPYSREVRESLLAISNRDCHTQDISRMNFLLPELYAKALETTCVRRKIPIESVELVGCHGQTIYHEDSHTAVCGMRLRTSMQIGDGSILAERVNIPVVSNFRPRDMAAGGKGAPLVPFVDYLLFRQPKRGRAVVNIGGIANVTLIPPMRTPEEGVLACDTGPGNMLMDQLAEVASDGRLTYDRDGKIAKRGEVNDELLSQLRRWSYYDERPPKTIGREQYGASMVEELTDTGLPVEDLMATACELTASTIADVVNRYLNDPYLVEDVVVSGGGTRNPELMRRLKELLLYTPIRTSEEFGIDPDAKEAIAFAVLAHETWHGRPSNVPTATGAKRAVILGQIALGPAGLQRGNWRPERLTGAKTPKPK